MALPPTRLLFVCYANLCRSPMAEALFRHRAEERGLGEHFEVDSAGTGAWRAGLPPHRGTLAELAAHGIDAAHLRSRAVTAADLQRFDWILAMDRENLRDLEALGPARGRRELILKYAPEAERLDVPDPFLDGGFGRAYELLRGACDGLLAALQQERAR